MHTQLYQALIPIAACRIDDHYTTKMEDAKLHVFTRPPPPICLQQFFHTYETVSIHAQHTPCRVKKSAPPSFSCTTSAMITPYLGFPHTTYTRSEETSEMPASAESARVRCLAGRQYRPYSRCLGFNTSLGEIPPPPPPLSPLSHFRATV